LKTEDEFLKNRVEEIRALAAKADPFIKRRLLDLAKNYERRAEMAARGTPIPVSPLNYPTASRDERG
jgi:hypothetical protein